MIFQAWIFAYCCQFWQVSTPSRYIGTYPDKRTPKTSCKVLVIHNLDPYPNVSCHRLLRNQSIIGLLVPVVRPPPAAELDRIHARLQCLVTSSDLLIEEGLSGCRTSVAKVRHLIDGFDGKAEPIRLVTDRKLKRRVDVALLGVSNEISFVSLAMLVSGTYPRTCMFREPGRL